MNEIYIFFLFYIDLDLNNHKILCLPSIYQFDRKLGFRTTLIYSILQFISFTYSVLSIKRTGGNKRTGGKNENYPKIVKQAGGIKGTGWKFSHNS